MKRKLIRLTALVFSILMLAGTAVVGVSADALIYGDVNGDGVVNVLDLVKITKHYQTGTGLNQTQLQLVLVSGVPLFTIADLLKIQSCVLKGDPITTLPLLYSYIDAKIEQDIGNL